MPKIKITRSFPSTHYGHLIVGQEVDVKEGFADFAVNRMNAAEYVKAPAKAKATTVKKAPAKKAKK